ncbi:MAG TPA: sigma-54 dependent transcriptional regulator [Planctomycetaceae bacterium]|nr:sigma-54 dependent transcriptional regulator [Planctomycetaceae bacterium]
MTLPIVVVCSRNPIFSSELSRALSQHFNILFSDSVQHAGELSLKHQAQALIGDFPVTTDGGHAHEFVISRLRQRLPGLEVLLLTAEHCPEPLERLAACGGITHLRGNVSAGDVVAWLNQKFPPTAEDTVEAEVAKPVDAKASNPSEAVLHGISRKFETSTPQLRRMLVELEVAAQHDVTVLLVGETGSGKTFLANLIHEVSPRREEAFLHVACGALPSELIESELFGHVKGAFTSAHADKDGKFVAAGGGTILLDEIDVLGPEQQVKLLRVIETGLFEPVGSNKTVKSQARLVVASNLDLKPLVEKGRFRPDLYYRLNMLMFELAPLRDRKPDIGGLTRKFVQQSAQKHNIKIEHIDDGLFAALYDYPWPGNVRELENVIQRAVIYCRNGRLTADQLPHHIVLGNAGPTNDSSVKLNATMGQNGTTLNHHVSFTERDIIEQTLLKNSFSRTNTAKALGISRVTLYNKMKKYGMLP